MMKKEISISSSKELKTSQCWMSKTKYKYIDCLPFFELNIFIRCFIRWNVVSSEIPDKDMLSYGVLIISLNYRKLSCFPVVFPTSLFYIFVVIVTGMIQIFFSVSILVCSVSNNVDNVLWSCIVCLQFVEIRLQLSLAFSSVNLHAERGVISSTFSTLWFYFVMSLLVTHRTVKPSLTNKS